MVIDDNTAILDVFNILLSDIYDVTLKQEVKNIFKPVDQIAPDLIVLDKTLYKADGCDYCKQLKADQQYQGIPIVIISANNTYQRFCLAAGTD